ncbi:tape measure protein [Sorangium sp. So ce1024]|uniref:tape measure protein n=1 Tax=Sorangium sp. So ce1024 TaxID=3133327 RepID=UPI003F096F92
MTNVIEWQLKVSQAGANQAARAIDKIAGSAVGAVGDVAKLGDATEAAAEAAMKAAGAYKDAAGRLRDVRGRFIKGGVEGLMAAQAAAAKLAETVESVAQVGPVLPESDIPKPALVRNLNAEFDALQETLGKNNANAVLWAQSVKRGTDNLAALRAAAKASAAPTDAEKMMMAAKPSDLIAQEGVMKRRLAMMEKLRAAAAKSAGPTDAERWINASVPAHLRAAPDLSRTQRVVRRVLQDLNQITGGRALGAVTALTGGFERMGPALEIAGGAARRMGPVLATIASGAKVAAVGVGALAAAGVVAGASFAQSVVQAQAQREGVMQGLEIQLESNAAAQQALLMATRTADMLGTARAETAGQFNDLLAKGFDLGRVDEIIRRMADLRVVDPKASTEGITRAISQIAGTGKLQGDELNQLAENGLETIAVYDALGKRLGKTRAEVIKLKESGKIDSDTAIQAILDAIGNQTGNKAAGTVASERSRNSLAGIFERLENLPGNFLFSIGVDKELDALKGSLNDLLTYFETSGATKVADALESTFGALVKGFTGIDVNQAGGITDTIDMILTGVIEARPQIESFAGGVRQAFEIGGAVVRAVGWFSQVSDSADRLVVRLGPFGASVRDFVIGPFEAGTNVVMGMVGAINTLSTIGLGGWASNIQGEIAGLASSAYTWASDIGAQIVAGIEAGVLGAYQRAIDAVSSVATGAITTAKGILGIQSPSKVFEQIGAFTVAGFERGIAANDTSALESLVAPPDLAAITGGAAAAAGRLGGGSGLSLQVNVDAKGATRQDAEHIADIVTERIVRELEARALMTGAAA